jgi:hypothetical protein
MQAKWSCPMLSLQAKARLDPEETARNGECCWRMTRPKHCLTILFFLFANLLMVACTSSQESPFTEREVQELRNRTLPKDGRLVATSRSVKNDFGIRAAWDIETTSDNQVYFQWLKVIVEAVSVVT